MTDARKRIGPIVPFSILLFISGGASLSYQVVWTRILHYSFGNTELAAAIVLAVFMGGLALGGWLGGIVAPKLSKPLIFYGILEGLVALYAFVATPALYHLDVLYTLTGPDPSPWLMGLLRFAVGLMVMLVPATAMGMTLPVLVRGVVRPGTEGRGISLLYFINTLGAVTGTFLSGFVTIPALGLDGTVYAAATAGLVVLVAAAFLQRYYPKPAEEYDPSEATEHDDAASVESVASESDERRISPSDVALFLAWAGGLISLVHEILWFRLFSILLDGTIYGFSGMLAAYLLGLALGSLWIAPRLDSVRDRWDLYTKLQTGASVGALLTMILLPMIPWVVTGLLESGLRGAHAVFPVKVALAFLTLLAPTFFYGAAFPVVVRLFQGSRRASSSVGEVYAWNTVGCIIGAIFTAMYLIPVVRDTNTLLLGAAASSAILALVAAMMASDSLAGRLKSVAYPVIALLLIAAGRPSVNVLRLVESRYAMEDYGQTINSRVRGIRSNPDERKDLVFYGEGRSTIVTVHEKDSGGLRLRNNGLNESYQSPSEPRYAEELVYLAAIPYALAGSPRRAMLIGLGGGGTLDSLAHLDSLQDIQVCELEEEVVRASRFMFGSRPHPLDDPRVHLRVDDGRNALLRYAVAKPHSFDLIVSQPSHPWLSGAANLYTYEHFSIVARNLTPTGVFCQWVNLFRMDGRAASSMMAAFVRAFPHVQIYQVDENSLFMVGSPSELEIDPERIRKRFSGSRSSELARLYGISPERFMDMYALGTSQVRRLSGDAPVNSDHMPIVETVLPWVTHHHMFRVHKWVSEHGVHYGITPDVIKGDAMAALEGYVKWLASSVNPATDDEDSLKRVMARISALEEVMGTPTDGLLRAIAALHVKYWNLNSALDRMSRIRRLQPSDEDLMASVLYRLDCPAVLAALLSSSSRARSAALAYMVSHLPFSVFPATAWCDLGHDDTMKSSEPYLRVKLALMIHGILPVTRGTVPEVLASMCSVGAIDKSLSLKALMRSAAVEDVAGFKKALSSYRCVEESCSGMGILVQRLAQAGIREGALVSAAWGVRFGCDVHDGLMRIIQDGAESGQWDTVRQALMLYTPLENCDQGWLDRVLAHAPDAANLATRCNPLK